MKLKKEQFKNRSGCFLLGGIGLSLALKCDVYAADKGDIHREREMIKRTMINENSFPLLCCESALLCPIWLRLHICISEPNASSNQPALPASSLSHRLATCFFCTVLPPPYYTYYPGISNPSVLAIPWYKQLSQHPSLKSPNTPAQPVLSGPHPTHPRVKVTKQKR